MHRFQGQACCIVYTRVTAANNAPEQHAVQRTGVVGGCKQRVVGVEGIWVIEAVCAEPTYLWYALCAPCRPVAFKRDASTGYLFATRSPMLLSVLTMHVVLKRQWLAKGKHDAPP